MRISTVGTDEALAQYPHSDQTWRSNLTKAISETLKHDGCTCGVCEDVRVHADEMA